jgi:uncharacterized membrane protein YhaH (DUF805 family)
MEEIQKAVKTCLTKYADFNGRAARPEFWWFMLAQFILHVILGMISPALDGLAALALLIPSLAAGSRRLHDIGKSGWLQLLGLIPIIGWILLIYWCAQPGEPGDNKYGAAPAGAAAVPDVAPGQQ